MTEKRCDWTLEPRRCQHTAGHPDRHMVMPLTAFDFMDQWGKPYPAFLHDLRAVLKDPDFKEAVRQAFTDPGDFGPAQGYYMGDVEHFLDMVESHLPGCAICGTRTGTSELDRHAWLHA